MHERDFKAKERVWKEGAKCEPTGMRIYVRIYQQNWEDSQRIRKTEGYWLGLVQPGPAWSRETVRSVASQSGKSVFVVRKHLIYSERQQSVTGSKKVGQECSKSTSKTLLNLIRNGTVLPK